MDLFFFDRQKTKCSSGRSHLISLRRSLWRPSRDSIRAFFFLVYINDISKGLTKGTTIRLFADDSLLYLPIKSPKDCEILQHDLNTLQNWEKIWKMEFHPGKCNLLQITNKRNPIDFIYIITSTIPLSKRLTQQSTLELSLTQS